MGYSQNQKQVTHQRILDVAADRFRERGFNGVSIADLMKDAGLTNGGFYAHFDSKDALIVAALKTALGDLDPFEAELATTPRRRLTKYVAGGHPEQNSSYCALATLANDVARSHVQARDVYTDRVKRIFEVLAKSVVCSKSESANATAMFVFSACIGSINLARAVSDPELSTQILEAALAQVQQRFDESELAEAAISIRSSGPKLKKLENRSFCTRNASARHIAILTPRFRRFVTFSRWRAGSRNKYCRVAQSPRYSS